MNKKILPIQQELRSLADPEIAKKSRMYMRAYEGGYGEGDCFLGLRVPFIRKTAKEHIDISFEDTIFLIKSKFHEERMLGLILLVYKYQKTKIEKEHIKIYKIYIKHFKYINNWDLVDITCPHIIGKHLMNRDRSILYDWIKSKDLWTRRIGMLANWWFVRKGDLKDVFNMAKILLHDDHDLMHKAVGWMLREAGKKDQAKLEKFLNTHCKKMPRVMLRYSIEKLPPKKRKDYLKR